MARCPTNAVQGKVLGKNQEGNLDLNFSLTQRGGGGINFDSSHHLTKAPVWNGVFAAIMLINTEF